MSLTSMYRCDVCDRTEPGSGNDHVPLGWMTLDVPNPFPFDTAGNDPDVHGHWDLCQRDASAFRQWLSDRKNAAPLGSPAALGEDGDR